MSYSHYIASMSNGTAYTDGWFQRRDSRDDGGFTHNAQKSDHISKGSVLALSSGGWSLKRLFLYDSAALILGSWTYVVTVLFCLFCTIYVLGERERHYKVDTRTSAFSRVSPRAARSSADLRVRG